MKRFRARVAARAAARQAASGGGVVAFLPTSIQDLTLWLDGADPAGTGAAPANNSTVDTWYDKSGDGNSATQTTLARRPLFKQNYTNGIGSLYFTTSNNMILPSLTVGPLTIFSIGKLVAYSGNNFFMSLLSGSGPSIYIRAVAGTNFGVDGHTSIITTISDANYHIFSYTQGTTASLWFDGTTIATGATVVYTAAQGSFTYGSNTLGGWNGQTNSVDSVLSEVIIYNSSLGTPQREKIEGYLAWKWGLQASLPGNHLYKSAAP